MNYNYDAVKEILYCNMAMHLEYSNILSHHLKNRSFVVAE